MDVKNRLDFVKLCYDQYGNKPTSVGTENTENPKKTFIVNGIFLGYHDKVLVLQKYDEVQLMLIPIEKVRFIKEDRYPPLHYRE